jgi:hypothetical protein
VVWGGLALLLLVAVLVYALLGEQRALEKMDPQARAALYEETWRGFRTLCQQQASPALAPRCREQAKFLQRFPECDVACRQELSSVARPLR